MTDPVAKSANAATRPKSQLGKDARSWGFATSCQTARLETGRLGREWVRLLAHGNERCQPVGSPLYVDAMPRISTFYGITILMFFGDHNPPHLHARYGGQAARIALDGTVLDGEIPRRAIRLVREWIELHHAELEVCWDRAVNHEPPDTIDPLP